jgi:hypothetical protein
MTLPLRVELLFAKDREAWRLYVHGWVAPYVRHRLSQYGEAFPLPKPDFDDLEKFMWETDAPYIKRMTKAEGAEIEATGRSAVALNEWLDEYLRS